jgi:cell division septal protein FtsQ
MNAGAIPIVAEPDQRYWRRRANRRVRKARLTRSLRRWSAMALALVIVGVALFQAGSHAVDRIKMLGGLTVRHLEIVGADRGGSESIRKRLASFVGRNIVDIDLDEVRAAVIDDPWVLGASAKRVLPGTLHVTVLERHPAAVAVIDEIAYVVDTTGFVVGRLEPGSFERLPTLTGLDRYEGQGLEAVLAYGVRTIGRLHEVAGPWAGELAEMDLSRRDRIAVRTGDPGPAILLDPERIDRNLNRYLGLQREIARRAGRLEYIDLRWQDRISVMPASSSVPAMEGG